MKKYDIYNLYVIEVKNNDDIYFFICKLNIFGNSYVDIFTKKSISKYNVSKIEPLSNYSLFLKENYISSNKTTIEETELMKLYKEINYKEDRLNEQTKNKILDKATLNFFPKTGCWHSNCFSKSDLLDKSYLPCHLRDELWLAKMIKIDQKLFNLSIKSILEYIKKSSFFKEQRHKYEQKIVKWQIEWIKSGGENWIVDEEYGGEFYLLGPYCDLAFRKGVVDTLLEIGMDREAIEEGIEKNADIWRDTFMHKAFLNEYNPPYLYANTTDFFKKDNLNNRKSQTKEPKLENIDPNFEKNWIKMRKYEYYQRHKQSVDKYGTIESCMLMSEDEVEKLKEYLKEKDIERKEQINRYKEQRKTSNEKSIIKKRINYYQ